MKLFDPSKIKVIAMDLDGTLTQHKEPLEPQQREALLRLSKKYKLLMVGAGQVGRIFRQLGNFPIDIIGNYGLQYGVYNEETQQMDILRDLTFPIERESVEERVAYLRQKYGFTAYDGESVEYHPSGCITFPILGTRAPQEKKLAFDPQRSKRRAIYAEVCDLFSDYTVFVGGSSSFDMSPRPYDKRYALARFAEEQGLSHDSILYIGDDYGQGGNDESVFLSDFPYLTIDDYRDFPRLVEFL